MEVHKHDWAPYNGTILLLFYKKVLQKDFVHRDESFETQATAKLFCIDCLHTYIKTYLESLNDICVTVSTFVHGCWRLHVTQRLHYKVSIFAIC